MSSSLAMSRVEREAFLTGPHVGVVSVAEPGRGPLTVPIWYRYEPGKTLSFVTGGNSRKARLMRAAGRIGFCVQSEAPPYQYVSIEGPVTFGKPDFERDSREVAVRYLGEQMGAMYLEASKDEIQSADNVLVVLTPERWYSVDYSKLG